MSHEARRDRFVRSDSGKRVSLQDRDLEWFKAIHHHGPLSTDLLHHYAGHESYQATQRRLGLLFHEKDTPHAEHNTRAQWGYLDRPRQQARTVDARYKDCIYDLNARSEAALQDAELWDDLAGGDDGHFWHSVMVASITCTIEIALRDFPEHCFIPKHEILAKLNVPIFDTVHIEHPDTGYREETKLIPDGLFGIEYPDGYISLFFVEADRGSEPREPKDFNRKSYLRSYEQYRQFVGRRQYKEHYGWDNWAFVLNVMNSKGKSKSFMDMVLRRSGNKGSNYMLFKWMDGFNDAPYPPKYDKELLTLPWLRAGHKDYSIV